MVDIGQVKTFVKPVPDKAQALKVVEEAAEVFGAWQEWISSPHSETMDAIKLECADVIQATCNLLASIGVTDFSGYMKECEVRNKFRGRAYEDTMVEPCEPVTEFQMNLEL